MNRVVKTFGDKTVRQVEEIPGSANLTWHKFKNVLAIAIGIKPDERIEGVIIDDTNIEVKLSSGHAIA